ncbi:hypothetical protein [uncultured Sphingobacterium sp.]|jgi:hypothetical protein|uniref:hypothetical protein n=1 Tax=uncultured Sphingobacterium sp. TaxID=182688 RepID=UPI003748EE40
MKTLAIIISFFFILISCDDVDSRFCVLNRTNQNIYAYLTTDSSSEEARAFFIDNGKPNQKLRIYKAIKQHDSVCFSIIGNWNQISNFDRDGNIFIFSVDSIEYDKEQLKANSSQLIKRYQITRKKLNQQGWRLLIPATIHTTNLY